MLYLEVMKKTALLIVLLAAALFPLGGQNNPYEIDDECYKLFRQTESLMKDDLPGRGEAFKKSSDDLLTRAITVGDKKAQVLYYVEVLKFTAHTPGVSEEEVEKAHEALCNISRKLGYKQYYYYSYELTQNYYYNKGMTIKAMELMQEMQSKALEEKDEYGVWVGNRYIAALYEARNDYVSAKKHLLLSIEAYNKGSDPTMKRQSITRQLCDLSDCYPQGSDSMKIYIRRAVAMSKAHLDTLRCHYYLAKLAASENRYEDFLSHKEYCLNDPAFPGTLFATGREYLEAVESIMKGNPEEHLPAIDTLERYPQQKFIADLAEQYGFHDISTRVHHQMISRLEGVISTTNLMRLSEWDARFGNITLSANLAQKSQQVTRITHFLILLLSFILATGLIFSIMRIRSLREREAKDKKMIEDLREANERAKVADAAKTRFVQNMSHEVRTPLNAIVGFSQLLSLPDGSFPEEEKEEFASHIINNTKMLTMLLDDILSTSQMDSGGYKITIEEGECHYICQSAISSAEHRLQPGVTMTYVPESDKPFMFRTDPRRAQQILINLLTNACKHTVKGSIVLASSLSENPGEVTFSVTDTGPGVPPEQAEKIFDRFTKLNEFVQGTGLGLSICREIATKMGGRVYLDTSYTAGGARFVFVLPIEPPQDKDNKQL